MFSKYGKSAEFVIPRLKSVTSCPASNAACTTAGPTKFVPPRTRIRFVRESAWILAGQNILVATTETQAALTIDLRSIRSCTSDPFFLAGERRRLRIPAGQTPQDSMRLRFGKFKMSHRGTHHACRKVRRRRSGDEGHGLHFERQRYRAVRGTSRAMLCRCPAAHRAFTQAEFAQLGPRFVMVKAAGDVATLQRAGTIGPTAYGRAFAFSFCPVRTTSLMSPSVFPAGSLRNAIQRS